jgi:hypothetical protein
MIENPHVFIHFISFSSIQKKGRERRKEKGESKGERRNVMADVMTVTAGLVCTLLDDFWREPLSLNGGKRC